jgi:hypothetical protein
MEDLSGRNLYIGELKKKDKRISTRLQVEIDTINENSHEMS